MQNIGNRQKTNKEYDRPSIIKQLDLTVGYNHSDSTFGWKGYKNALTIYYMHSNENFIKEEHSYSLVPGLTPVVSVKNVRTVLLGDPYKQCVKDIDYSTQGCLYGKLLDRVVRMCHCYPSYAEDGKNLKKKFSEVEECNFYLHATCVSFVKEQFDQTEVTCDPACYQDSIHQESIHYSKMDDKKIDFLQVTRKTSNQLSLISTQLKMAEVVGTIYQERPNYTINELVADIGGSLGLVLGLSMIDMLVFGRAVFRIFQRKCHAILSSRHELCNFILSKNRRYASSFRNGSPSSVARSVEELERSPGIAKRPILSLSNV